ncbi:MAG: bifunctional RNase H/acid phosphatase [Candidatus Nanopelagicales bacterium]|nr:bifunctional RNase H/acid phosphatase [Candidatus Nanopelagicales bacterium]
MSDRRRRLVVEADGGSRGNPGPAAYGAVVRDGDTGEVLVELADFLGTQTNNVAEYEGVIAGLAAAREIDAHARVEARLDSRLVVEQLSGGWSIKNATLRQLALRARAILPAEQVRYTWVPRAQNARADALANRAMDAAAAGRPARIVTWLRGAGDPDPYVDAAEHVAADADEEAVRAALAAGEAPSTGAGVAAMEAAQAGAQAVREALRASRAEELPGPSGNGGRATAPAAEPRIVGWSHADLGVPTTFVLLRHGVTQHSVEHRFSGLHGQDPGLIDLGRQQAEAAAEELARRGGADVLVTSPMRRTRETAAIVADRLGMPEPVVVDGLAEADFGAWDALTFAEVKQRWPDELAAWLASFEVPPPGGESFADVRRRVDAARLELLERFPRQRVLVVSHVTPIKVLVQHVLDAPAASAYRFELAPCSITTLAMWADGVSSVFGMGERGHLHGVLHETA